MRTLDNYRADLRADSTIADRTSAMNRPAPVVHGKSITTVQDNLAHRHLRLNQTQEYLDDWVVWVVWRCFDDVRYIRA